MTIGIKLSDGRSVSSDALIDFIFDSPRKALPVVELVVDREWKLYFYKALLVANAIKAERVQRQRGKSSPQQRSVAEDLFHDFTFGLFE